MDQKIKINGNPKKTSKMLGTCEKYGWTPISMKNDWKIIYKEGVKKAQ